MLDYGKWQNNNLYILCIIGNSEIIEVRLIPILGGEAGVGEVAFFIVPFAETAVVVPFQVVFDNERDDVVFQTFFEHDETAHSAIAILEGVNALEFHVEIENVFQCFSFLFIIFG